MTYEEKKAYLIARRSRNQVPLRIRGQGASSRFPGSSLGMPPVPEALASLFSKRFLFMTQSRAFIAIPFPSWSLGTRRKPPKGVLKKHTKKRFLQNNTIVLFPGLLLVDDLPVGVAFPGDLVFCHIKIHLFRERSRPAFSQFSLWFAG